MFTHNHYVPILKWKQGEYQAYFRLTDQQKDVLTPLFEIPPVGFDFEAQENRTSLDVHLGDLGRRMRSKLTSRACFVDLKLLPTSGRMRTGRHFVEEVFNDLRDNNVHAVPVIGLGSDAAFVAATADVVSQDGRGACLRLSIADFNRDGAQLAAAVDALLASLSLAHSEVDLVLDLGHRNFEPIPVVAQTIQSMIALTPAVNRWRSFTLAGTSYPASLAEIARPFGMVQRQEWAIYRHLIGQLGTSHRLPTFGDYAAAHPDLVELDMRLIKPFAKLRYTTPEDWYIAKGTAVRTNGFGQFQDMCADLVVKPFFDGPSFSEGDRYIAECAAGRASTGNLTTWVWVSSNRHFARVVADLAIFHAP